MKTIGIADTCPEEEASVSVNYTNAVLRAGHLPMVLPCTSDESAIHAMVERVDALLLPGGGADVDPVLYGESSLPQMGPVNHRRDEFEFALLHEAVAQRKPVLGICRGLQVINVFFGGTLYQDLSVQYGGALLEHQRPDQKWSGVHEISISADSRLYSILKVDTVSVNSTHHQAVHEVAHGFIASARTSDGVIEAIESKTLPILAVQFHPERLATGDDICFTRLFQWL